LASRTVAVDSAGKKLNADVKEMDITLLEEILGERLF
jgi:hypothetical protein